MYDNYADQRNIDFIYLGGMWTGNSNRRRRKQLLEGKNKKIWGGEDDIGVACCGCRRWSQDQDGCNAVED